MKDKTSPKNVIIMTITAGLGDYIIAGSLKSIVEKISPETKIIIIHKRNNHVNLWPKPNIKDNFFNVFKVSDILRLIRLLRNEKKQGTIRFGLQMAPGSIQGFAFLKTMKAVGAIDYIVDFNLINADIITPIKGEYILDIHLNQINELTSVDIPIEQVKLDLREILPVKEKPYSGKSDDRMYIGIHPWSRRGHHPSYRWPLEKWIRLALAINENKEIKAHTLFLILGQRKDKVLQFLSKFRESGVNNVEAAICVNVGSLIETLNKLDCLISINSGPIHITYILNIPTIVLNGPALPLWTPKSPSIIQLQDTYAFFPPNDKPTADPLFPSISRVEVTQVYEAVLQLLRRSQ